MASLSANNDEQNVVTIKNLNFRYDTGAPLNINGLDCVIPANAKVILVGANGAGKSTLLRILTGVIYLGLESDEFDIAGTATPHDQAMGVAYLGGVWKRRRGLREGIEPYSMDIAARDMMKKWQDENLERRDELVRVLGINLDWRMHECSTASARRCASCSSCCGRLSSASATARNSPRGEFAATFVSRPRRVRRTSRHRKR